MHPVLSKMFDLDRTVLESGTPYKLGKQAFTLPTYPFYVQSNIVTPTWCKNVQRPILAVLTIAKDVHQENIYLRSSLARIAFNEISVEIVDSNGEIVHFVDDHSSVTMLKLDFVFLDKNAR
jgi:hypothetical protein